MKNILISIKPEWVEKILNGQKTVEIRKTIPKCELPCKVYIYCTKGKDLWMHNKSTIVLGDTDLTSYYLNGKVVAEFTLNVVEDFEVCSDDFRWLVENTKCCLTIDEVLDYCNGQDLYGWYIDDLIIYDKPKELSEFSVYDKTYDNVGAFGWAFPEEQKYTPLKRPPQSWCYVE